MKLATVTAVGRGETDLLLSEAADFLIERGCEVAGIVKVQSYESAFENGCDMNVRVLPDGPVIRITQDLGEGSDACRLDPGAISEAVGCVENRSLDTADLFILNKFGPEEAAGRGFVSAIGKALEAGVPVLVGVGNASRDAFDRFADGMSETLPGNQKAIRKWCLSVAKSKGTV